MEGERTGLFGWFVDKMKHALTIPISFGWIAGRLKKFCTLENLAVVMNVARFQALNLKGMSEDAFTVD